MTFKIERKKTLTLNLSDREWKILENMCQKKEMTKSALIRHALAVYQSVEWPIDRSALKPMMKTNRQQRDNNEGE